ncbi:MAG TPA: NAD-dependent epimerase [Fusobacteria bacterium]|nr:NAD-dependent epimerase [Fusobacteriota bacterium]
MKKKIVVIGGAGFVGSHAADCLTKYGHEVTIFDNVMSPWISDSQKMLMGSILDQEQLDVATNQADVVFHFAGIADIKESSERPFDTFNLNVMGTVNLLESCIKNNVERLIYASTMYVYSEHGSFYKASKQASETIIESYSKEKDISFTFLRYGSLYGPRSQKWNGLNKIVNTLLREKKLIYKGTGNEFREYIHVEDASELSVKAIEEQYENKALILTGHQEISSSQLIEMIGEISGEEFDVKFEKEDIDPNHYAFTPYRYSPKRAQKLIPDNFRDLGQGILELIEINSDQIYAESSD